MKFYSYDYVLSQISQTKHGLDWLWPHLLGRTYFSDWRVCFKAYKDRHDTKFRELSIISI